jgi:capsid protein
MRERVAARRLARTAAIRGAYDAAQTTHENTRHWGWTDSLSADSANSPSVRQKLRERARYEVANNGWARSMVETLAHEVIGTGPRIQILTGNPKADEWIERAFAGWCQQVRFARKCRTLRKAKAQDGEGIGLFVTNERLGDVQLDVRLIETEQMSTPGLAYSENQIDGVDLDDNDNPTRYHILKHHPGESRYGFNPLEEISPPPRAEDVLHIFRQDRPGQHRGIPELTPALPLFSKLRRYTLAVLQTAENIADITIGLQTERPETALDDYGPSGTSAAEPASYETFDTFDLERGLVTVLPEGTTPWQPDPKQPATTHTEFVKSVLAEAFAAVCMPYSVGAADSSDENFASGKLTRLGFKRAIQIERRLDWDPEVV